MATGVRDGGIELEIGIPLIDIQTHEIVRV
jgi:hypothetical protein